MTDNNINEFDKHEKKTESENENDEDIKKENEKRKLISALIAFDNVIKQISNIDEESSKSLTELTDKWKVNIKSKYEITEKDIDNVKKPIKDTGKQDIDNVKKPRKDTRKQDIEDMENRITKLQDEIKELKKNEKAVKLLKELKNTETRIRKVQDEINKLKSEQQLTNIKSEQLNDEIDKLTVRKSIVQYASQTASIGPILTVRLVEFVEKEHIRTVEQWQNAVENGTLKNIVGIGKGRVRVLKKIQIALGTIQCDKNDQQQNDQQQNDQQQNDQQQNDQQQNEQQQNEAQQNDQQPYGDQFYEVD